MIGNQIVSLILCVREVGSWKELFTKTQLKKVEAKILQVSETSDVMKLWEKEWFEAGEAAK